MRYFCKNPRVKSSSSKEHIPLFNRTAKKKVQITFKDGNIVYETKQDQLINICMIKGALQFCIKGEPYVVQEGDILNLDPHACCPQKTLHEDAIILTLVKADATQALEEKRKCGIITI